MSSAPATICRLCAACCLTVFALSAWAQERLDPLPDIVAQQHALKAEIESGSAPYSKRQIREIRRSQDIVFSTIGDETSLAALSIDERVELQNALERINSEVAHGSVRPRATNCRREPKLGSKFKSTLCASRAERDEIRDGARDYMQRPRVCVPPGCGEMPGGGRGLRP